MQSIIGLATCLFDHYTSALWVRVQQYWISFKTAAHCRELELHFSTNDLQTSVHVFVLVATLETYIHYDFEC